MLPFDELLGHFQALHLFLLRLGILIVEERHLVTVFIDFITPAQIFPHWVLNIKGLTRVFTAHKVALNYCFSRRILFNYNNFSE